MGILSSRDNRESVECFVRGDGSRSKGALARLDNRILEALCLLTRSGQMAIRMRMKIVAKEK